MKKNGLIGATLLSLTALTIFLSTMSSLTNHNAYAITTNNIVQQTNSNNKWLWYIIKDWLFPPIQKIEKEIQSNEKVKKTIEEVKKTTKTISNLEEKVTFFNLEEKCNPPKFIDISWYKYQSSIELLASKCIVKWTIKPNRFYPNNIVRRADLLTMFVKSYQKFFINDTKPLEIKNFEDLKPWTKIFNIVQAANYMWIVDLLVGKNTKKIWLDNFVSKADVVRLITLLHTVKPIISDKWLDIILWKQGNITRWELAYIVAQSLNLEKNNKITKSKKNNWQKMPDPTKNLSALQELVRMWVLSSNDAIVNTYAITRKQFLTLLVKFKHYLNPSIPISVPNMHYFVDVNETWQSIITQAKNLGFTAFFEEKIRWKLYLHPNNFVTEYEASVVINQLAKNKLKEDKTKDNVYVQNEKVAQMLLIAAWLKNDYDFETEDKIDLSNIVSVVKWWFRSD